MVSAPMQPSVHTDLPVGQLEARFDPFVRLLRSLLPRAACVALFGGNGELMWSTDPTLGPDLLNAVDDALLGARAGTTGQGQLRTLAGNTPVYLCPLRGDAGQLLGVIAIVCRTHDAHDKHNPKFAFAHSLIAPALECLRRELITRATIEELNATVSTLEKDLNLLLLVRAPELSAAAPDGVNELQLLVQQTIEHLRACTGALLVPEKNITLASSASGSTPDTQFLMRAHKRLLAMAHSNPEPLISNETLSAAFPDSFPYRVLCCSLRSRAGRPLGVLALLRDAAADAFTTRDAHVAEILARKAIGLIESNYDSLSGLYTRAAFERRVRAVVTDKKVTRQWCALYVDVDQLHLINEKSGMHVGDAVLAELGELLRQRLPPGAFGARISGDRFAVLLPAHASDAEKFAEALRAGAELTGATQGEQRLPVSISIGVALLDNSAAELAHVLAAAETACKAAKDRGRNRVEVYRQSDESIVQRHADIGIAGQLRDAINAGRLHLHAQLILPLAAAATARPHFELLLRMTDETGKTVGPDTFLSAATRYQLMPVIDRWVVNHVIEALQPRASVLEGKALGFSINFSGQSLSDDTFSDMLIERISSSGLDPELFCFELTENATVAALPRALALMQRLRKLGCGVALDDFGTGLSSLSCLRELPVTMLKIDGSFVRDVLKDARAESMVRAIAQLARSMSITTVAEYVETPEIAARVASLGVDYGQGFAIGRPIPFTDLLSELPLPDAPVAAADATTQAAETLESLATTQAAQTLESLATTQTAQTLESLATTQTAQTLESLATTQTAQVPESAPTDEIILTDEPPDTDQSEQTIEEPVAFTWFAGRTQ
jgi:diguanylate cyclase (GGDEF)-like protein